MSYIILVGKGFIHIQHTVKGLLVWCVTYIHIWIHWYTYINLYIRICVSACIWKLNEPHQWNANLARLVIVSAHCDIHSPIYIRRWARSEEVIWMRGVMQGDEKGPRAHSGDRLYAWPTWKFVRLYIFISAFVLTKQFHFYILNSFYFYLFQSIFLAPTYPSTLLSICDH